MNRLLYFIPIVLILVSAYAGNIGEKIEKYPVNAQNITITAEENIYVNDCNGTDPFGDGIKYFLMPYLLFGEKDIQSIHANYSIRNQYIEYYNFTITYTYALPPGAGQWFPRLTSTYTIYFKMKQANSEPVLVTPKVTFNNNSIITPVVFYTTGSWDPNYVYKWEITTSTWTAKFDYGQALGNYFIYDSFKNISQIKQLPLVYGFDNNLNYMTLNPAITFTVNRVSDTRIETIMLIKFTDPNDVGKTLFRLFIYGVLGVQFDKYFKIQSTQDTIEVKVYFNIVQNR